MNWQDTTSATYWDTATGSWNGTSWDENVALSEVKVTPTGWEVGYAPTKLKITASAASLTVCYKTSSGAQYAFGYTPGDEIVLTQAGDIEFVQAVDDGDFQVTKLELYGDAITFPEDESEEEETTPTATPGTSTMWSLRTGRVRGYKHRPLAAKTR